MKSIAKWGCLGILVIIAVPFIITGVYAFVQGFADGVQNVNSPNHQEAPADPKQVSQKQPTSGQPSVQDAIAGAQDYYDASSAGNFNYTYNHLSLVARQTYTQEQWNTINEVNASAGASYDVQSATATGNNTYQVDLVVNGAPRTTYFIYDSGAWYHDPVDEEYAMYDGGLSSGASASASASASAAPAAPASSGEVAIKVVISASKPVDVSVISMDMGVPMISEQVQSKTYTFSANTNKDLTVDATDPAMDFNADDNINIKVYENGELKAQDSDDVAALVQY